MSSWKRMLSVAVTAMLAAGAARAEAPRFEVSGFGAYRVGGEFDVVDGDPDTVDLDDGGGWGVGLGIYRDPGGFYEFFYSTQDTEFDSDEADLGGIDVRVDYYQLGGTLLFDHGPRLQSSLSLTIGAARYDADGFDAETEFAGSLGLGLRVPLADNFAFLLGARGYVTVVENNTRFFCGSAGGQGACLVQSDGSLIYQGEASAGFVVKF